MTVLIATKNRHDKLLRCLNSIPENIPVSIHATAADGVPQTQRQLDVSIGSEGIVPAFNLLATRTTGAVLPVPDDVQFSPGFFDILTSYSDENSNQLVIGCHVTNRHHNEDAVTLVRREAITTRGFLFDPRFHHFFIDFELGRWAKLRSVFGVCREACLEHFHPEVSGEYDSTHRHRRMDKWRHDKAVWDAIRGISPAPALPTPQI